MCPVRASNFDSEIEQNIWCLKKYLLVTILDFVYVIIIQRL